MSKAASAPRRRSPKPKAKAAKAKPVGYLPDRIVGALLVAMDVLGVALGGFVVKGGKAVGPSGLGAFMLVYFALLAVVHAGVFASRRWAFVGAAILAAVSLSGQSLHLSPKLFLSTSLWTLAYGVLRAVPVLGPKPR